MDEYIIFPPTLGFVVPDGSGVPDEAPKAKKKGKRGKKNKEPFGFYQRTKPISDTSQARPS